jgi:predicted AAA+ superfamily ATPase
MKIIRQYQNLENHITANKVLVIFGPRQIGKTTLLKDYIENTKIKHKFVTGDNLDIQDVLSSQRLTTLKSFTEGYELLIVDEAQLIPKIGVNLKLLVDNIPGIKIIATGSSSFELSGQIGEPLTGRKKTIQLFPIALSELKIHFNEFEIKQQINDYLIFGMYPEILTAGSSKERSSIANELTNSYLLKDILELERVKSSKILLNLLRLLAFQVGSEVSMNELSRNLRIDVKTVARYLDLFEKSFIIKSLGGFSKNLRKEVVKTSKYYFYDNGIRNALIANFNPPELRSDMGMLWENFIIMERLKKQHYQNIYCNNYFWRTYSMQEIDFVEERDGELFGYEIKWTKKKVKTPKEWQNSYPDAHFEVISKDNFFEFIV